MEARLRTKNWFASALNANRLELHDPIALIYFLALMDAVFNSGFHLSHLVVEGVTAIHYPVTLSFFNFLSIPTWALIFFVLNMTIPFLTFIYRDVRWLRLFWAVLFLVSKGFIFSAVQFAHSYWPLLWALIFLSLPKTWAQETRSQPYSVAAYRAALLGGITLYFFPGFWKLVHAITTGALFNWDYAANTVAYYLLSHGKISLLSDFIVSHQAVSYFSFLLLITLQLLSPLSILRVKWMKLYAIFIFGFHSLNIMTLQVNYFLGGIVVMILLWFAPAYIGLNPNKICGRGKPEQSVDTEKVQSKILK
jgi:hypothetical protein